MKSNGYTGHPCLVFDLCGNSWGFFFYRIYRYLFLCWNMLSPWLIMKWCWIMSKAFMSVETVLWFLSFSLTSVMNYIYWFLFIEPSLHWWTKASLIMMNVLFDVILNSVNNVFCILFISEFCLQFSFFLILLSGFSIREILASQKVCMLFLYGIIWVIFIVILWGSCRILSWILLFWGFV